MDVIINALWWLFVMELVIAGAIIVGAAGAVFYVFRWIGRKIGEQRL